MTESSSSTNADGPAKPARAIPTRKKPTAAGKAGRWVAAGGAVGASLALVGAMSAAADHNNADQPQETAEAVRRVVVVPQDSTPNRIVIVLPEAASSGGAQPVVQQPGTAQARPAVVAAPAKPAAPEPAPAPVAAPVTESSGS